MSDTETYLPSGSKLPGAFKPVHVMEIGNPGQPTEIIIHNGRMIVYDSNGNTIIDGGIVQTGGVAVGLKSWVHDISFTATDEDTASWGSGTIYFGDGNTTSINAGNTGNIAATTYVYYDGTATLQKTTDPSFLDDSNLLVATVTPTAVSGDKVTIVVERSAPGTISADRIVAGSMSADFFSSGTIKSKQILLSVTDGAGDSYIASGKSDFTNVDPGFILGIDDSDSNKAKLYIGNSTEYFNWDGSNVIIHAQVFATGGIIGGYTITSTELYSDLETANGSVYITSDDGGRISVGGSSNRAGITGSGSVSTSVAIWAGGLYADRASADFRVTRGGAVTCSNLTVTGGSAGGSTITSTAITGGIIRTSDSSWRAQMDNTSKPFKYYDGSTERFWVDNAGNVNIRGSFAIYAGSGGIGAMGNVDGEIVLSSLEGYNLRVTAANTLYLESGTVFPSAMTFKYGASTIAQLDSEGFKIKNSSHLYIFSAGNDKYINQYHDDSNAIITTNIGDLYLSPGGGDVICYRLQVDPTGTAGKKIRVGDDSWLADINQANTLGVYNSGGTGYGNARANNWYTPSSIEYKENITKLDKKEKEKIFNEVRKLKPSYYKMRNNGLENPYEKGSDKAKQHEDMINRINLGIIAEEAPGQIKSLDGRSISLGEYINYLTVALQVAIDKIDELEKKM